MSPGQQHWAINPPEHSGWFAMLLQMCFKETKNETTRFTTSLTREDAEAALHLSVLALSIYDVRSVKECKQVQAISLQIHWDLQTTLSVLWWSAKHNYGPTDDSAHFPALEGENADYYTD